MVVNQDHYINRVFTEPGEYPLTTEEFDTPYVLLAARVLVDPTDSDDVAQVHAIQDGFGLSAAADEPLDFGLRRESFTRFVPRSSPKPPGPHGTHGMFGKKEEVDPHTHMLGTAAGWGGLPEQEAYYESREPRLPVGRYTITPRTCRRRVLVHHRLRRDGFLHRTPDAYSVNSVSGTKNAGGSITVTFGGTASDVNTLPLKDGWNYTVRMYRPRPEILDGTWTFPDLEPAT